MVNIIIMNDEVIYGDNLVLPETTKDERLSIWGKEYKHTYDCFVGIKEKLEYLKEQMLAEFPEEPGEYDIPLDTGGRLKITSAEKYEWDARILEEMFSDGGGRPDCVSNKFSVTKRLYDSSDDDTKAKLRSALTIKRGSSTIKVLKT